MHRTRPLALPRTPAQLVAILLLVAGSWCWDAAVRTWTTTPTVVAATLQADPRLLRPADLPATAVATLVSRPIAHALAADLLGATSFIDRTVAAWVLAHRLDDETQLVLYLNTVPMGERGGRAVRGLDDAAIVFFGKRVTELDADELTVLLGMTAPAGGSASPARSARSDAAYPDRGMAGDPEMLARASRRL